MSAAFWPIQRGTNTVVVVYPYYDVTLGERATNDTTTFFNDNFIHKSTATVAYGNRWDPYAWEWGRSRWQWRHRRGERLPWYVAPAAPRVPRVTVLEVARTLCTGVLRLAGRALAGGMLDGRRARRTAWLRQLRAAT